MNEPASIKDVSILSYKSCDSGMIKMVSWWQDGDSGWSMTTAIGSVVCGPPSSRVYTSNQGNLLSDVVCQPSTDDNWTAVTFRCRRLVESHHALPTRQTRPHTLDSDFVGGIIETPDVCVISRATRRASAPHLFRHQSIGSQISSQYTLSCSRTDSRSTNACRPILSLT